MVITLKSLRAKGAPPKTLSAFRKTLDTSDEVSEAALVSIAEDVDWGWMAANYLTPESQLAYHQERVKAFKEYQEAASPAEQEYLRLTAWPFDKFEHVTREAHHEYEAALAPLYAAFRSAVYLAHTEFSELQTRAFAKHNRDLLPAQMAHRRAVVDGHAKMDPVAVAKADLALFNASTTAFAEYEQFTAAAYERYAHVRDREEATYNAGRSQLREAYHAKTSQAYADIRPVLVSTDKQYKRVTSEAHSKYQRARAATFANLLLSQS